MYLRGNSIGTDDDDDDDDDDGRQTTPFTLASRGLEELFLQLCCCVSFWCWREIGFGFTYYLLLPSGKDRNSYGFFFGLRAMLIFSRRPKYIKNAP